MRFPTLQPTHLAAAAIVSAAGILAGGLALRPALAGGHAGVDPSAVVNCTSASPCQTYHNKGAGPGLLGSGSGVGVKGTATGNGIGVQAIGVDNSAVSAVSTKGYGVSGTSGSAYGVYGASTSSFGVSGSSSWSYGVQGYSPGSIGVAGVSANYIGVYASSTGASPGLYAYSTGGNGVEAHGASGIAVAGLADGSSTAVLGQGGSGRGIDATSSGGLAAYVYNNSASGNGLDATGAYIGSISRSQSFPILATDLGGANLFYIDGVGNVFYHGTLNTFARTRDGRTASAFGSKTTSPTIEDNGSGQLINGVATVILDPTFAQTIDARTVYHVMLTPDGDTRGLFVESKSPRSFVVREVQGGRSSLGFDYHIYATPLGLAGARMTVTDRASMLGPHARPVVFHAPKATRLILHHT